jgi:valyl-tRNA synthetase
LHENKIPWQDITISGFVTLEGQKMSKSKGKAIHPQEVMEKYGADSLRYWASTSKLGEDLDYQEKDLVTGKKFITKIANAANFVFMNIKPVKAQPFLETTDRLFLQQLNSLIQEATESFNEYNYSKAKSLADSFFWKTFADNYLEIIKYRVYNGSEKEKASASYTLYQSLLTILKLMAPITPYITEEIYQKHFKKQEKAKSIHITDWPKPFNIKTAKEDNKTWQTLIQTISKVRQEKAIAKKSVKAEISLKLPKQDLQILKPVIKDFQAVTNAKSINPGNFKMDFL